MAGGPIGTAGPTDSLKDALSMVYRIGRAVHLLCNPPHLGNFP